MNINKQITLYAKTLCEVHNTSQVTKYKKDINITPVKEFNQSTNISSSSAQQYPHKVLLNTSSCDFIKERLSFFSFDEQKRERVFIKLKNLLSHNPNRQLDITALQLIKSSRKTFSTLCTFRTLLNKIISLFEKLHENSHQDIYMLHFLSLELLFIFEDLQEQKNSTLMTEFKAQIKTLVNNSNILKNRINFLKSDITIQNSEILFEEPFIYLLFYLNTIMGNDSWISNLLYPNLLTPTKIAFNIPTSGLSTPVINTVDENFIKSIEINLGYLKSHFINTRYQLNQAYALFYPSQNYDFINATIKPKVLALSIPGHYFAIAHFKETLIIFSSIPIDQTISSTYICKLIRSKYPEFPDFLRENVVTIGTSLNLEKLRNGCAFFTCLFLEFVDKIKASQNFTKEQFLTKARQLESELKKTQTDIIKLKRSYEHSRFWYVLDNSISD